MYHDNSRQICFIISNSGQLIFLNEQRKAFKTIFSTDKEFVFQHAIECIRKAAPLQVVQKVTEYYLDDCGLLKYSCNVDDATHIAIL